MDKPYSQFNRGTHLIAEIKTSHNLENHQGYLDIVKHTLKEVGLSMISESHHIFDNDSFTSTVLLAESHINVHTYPEYEIVFIDIFICNFQRDNSESITLIYEDISNYFQSVGDNVTILKR